MLKHLLHQLEEAGMVFFPVDDEEVVVQGYSIKIVKDNYIVTGKGTHNQRFLQAEDVVAFIKSSCEQKLRLYIFEVQYAVIMQVENGVSGQAMMEQLQFPQQHSYKVVPGSVKLIEERDV